MHRNYFLTIVGIALACLILIFFSLWKEIDTPVTKEVEIDSPLSPYRSYISGTGIVEASTENILIGSPSNRIVSKVPVKVGQFVKKGDILFRLEDRDLQANLIEQQAVFKTAVAKLQRLEAFPRPEDLASATASLKSSQAELETAKNQYEMVMGLPDPRAISQEERNRRYLNLQNAEAKYQQAQADLNKIQGGTWKHDLEIARLDVLQAKASLNRIKTDIARTIIQSPIDGTVLQIKIHEGEFPPPDTLRMPLMIIGDTNELYLRVNINQFDIPSFQPDAPAVAYLQGDASIVYPLEFKQVEPYLVGKQTLTNQLTEKVDTRVLQIIYRIKKDHHQLFVGQQMDVFIEIKPS